ncbi:SDR family oxidoreductase [Streptomyces sp. NPDC013455]|uniref:SDR family oxidoreductase n=1 Tax=Streptomyces sp. NPDC013455 TaxID=3155605 RepID=UPI0033C08F4B
MRLTGKVVVITGAARGIGRATAVACAAEGADVVLLDVCADLPGVPYPLGSAGQLEHTGALCRDRGASVLTVKADVRDTASVRDAVELARERYGRIDAVVNNAGIAAPSGKQVHEISEDEWALMIDVDLTGAWRLIREVGKAMCEQRSGSIVNIASTAGLVGYRHFAGYVAAKHGLIGLTKAAALDYAPMKVRVNAVSPGNVRDTAGGEGRMLREIARALDVPADEHVAAFTQSQPMNRLVEPDDVAGAVVFLVSDDSAQVTGSVLTVDGGFTAH